jgi:hypothetical protein
VLGSSVRAHSVSSKALIAAFPGEPLTLAEAVCLQPDMLSLFPLTPPQWPPEGLRRCQVYLCSCHGLLAAASVAVASLRQVILQKLYAIPSHRHSASGCSGLLGDRTQGNTHLNTGEGALLVSTAQGEIKLSPSQLVPRALVPSVLCLFLSSALSFRSILVVAVSFDCPAQTEKKGQEGLPSDSAAPLRWEMLLA